jgi:hypothetical protein
MKLILNKNILNTENIRLLNKKNGYKILYKLNNVWMNGIYIKINDFTIYKNDEFLYIILSNEDNKIINDIINHINKTLKINICLKNNILKILNTTYNGEETMDLNISNIKCINNKHMLYIYD